MYHIIVAQCKNRGIGYENKIPWQIYEDMKLFSKKTRGQGNNAIIMGRKTWDSLPSQPLLKRTNIIVSSTLNVENENVFTFRSILDVKKHCSETNYDEVWIIGGQAIYEEFLKHAKTIHITQIDKTYKCDTFFPEIPENFTLISSENLKDGVDLNIYALC